MPKPLGYYCSSRKDSPIFKLLEREISVLDRDERLLCAVIALGACLEKRLVFSVQGELGSPDLKPVGKLVSSLSPGARLELAKALLEQVEA